MRSLGIQCFLFAVAVSSAPEAELRGQAADTPATPDEINQWIVQLQHDEDRSPSASPSAAKLIKQGTAAIPAIRAVLLRAETVSSQSSSTTYVIRLPHSDSDVRMSANKYSTACHWAIYVLLEIGPETVPLLVEAMNQGRYNTVVVTPSAEALRQLGSEGVDALVALVDSPQEYVRHVAISALRDNYPYDSRQGRLKTLAELGELEQMVNIWIDASENADYYVRYQALMAMENAGKYSDRVLPILIQALQDHNPTVRQGACDAFADICTDNADALNALLQALHAYPETSNLPNALATHGEAAIPGLLETLKSQHPSV